MKIFTLFTMIIFYFIAFMEKDPPEQAAYTKLGLDLGKLEEKLKILHHNISDHSTSTTEVDAHSVDRIEKLMNEVEQAREKYASKVKKRIKKQISITKQVAEVEKVIDEFPPINLPFDDALNTLIHQVAQVWEEQIQNVIRGVMGENG